MKIGGRLLGRQWRRHDRGLPLARAGATPTPARAPIVLGRDLPALVERLSPDDRDKVEIVARALIIVAELLGH